MKYNTRWSLKVKWIKNRGAILIVVWSYFIGTVFHLLRTGYHIENNQSDSSRASNTGIILVGSMLLYPIGGWLSDTRMGRYTVIRYSMWVLWTCSVLATLSEVLVDLIDVHRDIGLWVYRALIVIMSIALGGFQSNVMQLGVDQLVDSSSAEIISFITWYTLTFFASGVTLHFASYCVQLTYTKAFITSVCLTLAVCSDFLFHRWLVKERVNGMSLRSVLKIIKYILANRELGCNLADQGEEMSLFDVAKYEYGGPFKPQQVENVKKFIWLIFVIGLCAFTCGIIFPLEYAQDKELYRAYNWDVVGDTTTAGCYRRLGVHYFGYILAVVVILIYELVVYPLCYQHLPSISITSTFTVGVALLFVWIMSLLTIESVSYHHGLYLGNISKCVLTEYSRVNIKFEWFILPKCLHGVASVLLVLSSFKLIWSQAPLTMTGMIFGCAYSLLGLSVLIHTAIASPFIFRKPVTVSWTAVKFTCGIWYFLMEAMIMLALLILLVMLVKRYKKSNKIRVN